jgi:centrosomal protein CEP120
VDLESKVIWELENWKKAEEAKFKYELKQREVEYLEKIKEDRRLKEIQRDKIFKEHEAKLNGLKLRLEKKMTVLVQRENNLVLLEEELK